jgi:hypothetical protein
VPILPSSAYGTVEGIFTEARAIINDMMVSQAGEILTDVAPFTFPMLNRAARYFEDVLTNHGFRVFNKETVLTVPATTLHDPGQTVNISDSGYYNGSANFAQPQIPTDLQEPTDLWERQTGSTEHWRPMHQAVDGLGSQAQTTRLRTWEWRTDAIWMPGATQSEDIRLRYIAEIIQFANPNDVVLIRSCQSAIASYLAFVFDDSRGSALADKYKAQGDDFSLQICRRNTRAGQRETITRRPYGGSHASWK